MMTALEVRSAMQSALSLGRPSAGYSARQLEHAAACLEARFSVGMASAPPHIKVRILESRARALGLEPLGNRVNTFVETREPEPVAAPARRPFFYGDSRLATPGKI
jgi:hypothetical protein